MDAPIQSDVELLSAWATRDGEAGNQLIERHFAVVYRFFRNKVLDADIEDLVQQTFLACLEHHARYDPRWSVVAFLLGIARNQLYNYYRRRRREPIGGGASSLLDDGTSPTGAVARSEDARLLSDALLLVPLDAQVILELSYVEGMDGHEIAAVLGIAAGAVHTRLHRARHCLRETIRALAPDRIALADRVRELLTQEA